MSIPCPQCGREYDVTLFQFGNKIECVCGEKLPLSHKAEESGGNGTATDSDDEDMLP